MLIRLAAVSLTLLSATHGFIFPYHAHPALQDFAKAHTGTHLDIRLIIGKDKDESQMFLDGMGLELSMDPKTGEHPSMPGANGPHPKLSSGVRTLDVTSKPFFIGMNGMENVEFLNGCWEMNWREKAPAGVIVCGFDVPEEVKRNGVSLQAGRVYLHFPIWTKEGLTEYQLKKLAADTKAEEFVEEKKEQLAQMEATNNILKKAMHFRNACSAMENLQLTGAERYANLVPSSDDLIAIQDDLFLTTKGTIWRKDKNFFGAQHELLGSALVLPKIVNGDDGVAGVEAQDILARNTLAP